MELDICVMTVCMLHMYWEANLRERGILELAMKGCIRDRRIRYLQEESASQSCLGGG